jgi:hypothetical protein
LIVVVTVARLAPVQVRRKGGLFRRGNVGKAHGLSNVAGMPGGSAAFLA